MLKNWQQQYHFNIINKPLNNIIVPGTHDSGAYILNPKYESACYKKIGGSIKIGKDWALCQDYTILDQLIKGVRHFDIRLTKENDIFYVSHTFICDKFSYIIDQFHHFMINNKEEFIFIFFDGDSNGNFIFENDMHHIINILRDKFGDMIVFSESMVNDDSGFNYLKFPTYFETLKNNKRIFCYTKRDRMFVNPWINVSDTDQKYNYILDQYENYREKNYNILSFTVTPQTSDIVKSVFLPCSSRSNLRQMSEEIKEYLHEFIKEKREKVACYVLDFITIEDTKQIIRLNKYDS